MRALPATLLAAVLALLLAAPAQAAGSSPSPPRNASPEVKAIYTDYSRDGTLVECDHAQADLQTAYDTMTREVADDFPDFRDEVKLAIEHHKAHHCANEDEGSPPAAAPPPPAATPAPTASPAATPESGQLPESEGAAPQGGALPPGKAITPVPSATVPPVATPAP